jgi:hypothetical protein
MSKLEKGAWMLGTRASAWELDCPAGISVTTGETLDTIKRALGHFEETSITVFETRFPDLTLSMTFSNECKLTVFANKEDALDLPYWELFTPEQMLLRAGPGSVWSYVRADQLEVL